MIVRRVNKFKTNSLLDLYRPCLPDEIVGQETSRKIIKNGLDAQSLRHTLMFTGPAGCVDCDTEFLSDKGWKKISDYTEGDLVLQYNMDGTANFVVPQKYIKRKSEKLNLIKTKYGVNQCLSDDHRVLYYIKDKPYVKTFSEVKEMHSKTKYGFTGKFKTTFTPTLNTSMDLTDEELRVQVMAIADGSFRDGYRKCCVNIKKHRKINRAQYLLDQAGIEYDYYENSIGYSRFIFEAPIKCKEFDSRFYNCSYHQIKIIADEVFNWDGNENEHKFYSTSYKSAGFIQYVFASIGLRSTIYEDVRPDKGNTCYVVCVCYRSNLVGILGNINGKPEVKEFIPKDGYEYCFTVPSSYLVLRRKGKIFITGNCGKTTAARIVALGLNCESSDGPTSEPCLECKSCREILNDSSIDFTEVNVGREGGKAAVDNIVKNLTFAPMRLRYKVLIFDEAHQLTTAARDLLLKPIEDGFSHVFYIFCTNQPEKLRSADKQGGTPFIDRCSILAFNTISKKKVYQILENICVFEGVDFNSEILDAIATESSGVPRKAINWLEQVLLEGSWSKEALRDIVGVIDEDDENVYGLVKELNNGNFNAAIKEYDKIKENMAVESIRIVVAFSFLKMLKTEKNLTIRDNYSKILEIIRVPIYETGKVGDIAMVHNLYKITKIMARG